jgi:tape measure domain-containing protein
MAVERVIIMFEGQGAENVAKKIDGISKSSAKAEDSLNNLARVTSLLFGGNIISLVSRFAKSLIETGDAYIVLENRISLVTSSQKEANDVMEQILGVAQRTRSPIDQTGDTFFRLAEAIEQTGRSSETAISMTETLLSAFIATNGSISQARNAVTQLSVALEQNSLTARQFRSLVGSQPVVLNELARALGLTTNQFRELGAKGRITASQLVDAFAIAGDTIARDLAKIQPTVESTVVQLKDTFAEFAAASGLNTQIAADIQAENEGIRNILGLKSAQLIQLESEARRSKESLEAYKRQKAGISELDEKQKEYLRDLGEESSLHAEAAKAAINASEKELAALKLVQDARKKKLITLEDALDQGFKGPADLKQKGFTLEPSSSSQAARDAVLAEVTAKGIAAVTSSIGANVGQIRTDIERINDAYAAGAITLQQQDELMGKLQERIAKASPDANSARIAGAVGIGLLKQDNRGIGEAMVSQFLAANGAARSYQQTIAALNEDLKIGAINQQQYALAVMQTRISFLESQRTVDAGFERGFLKIGAEITDFASQSELVVTDAFHGMEKVLTDFVTTGKVNFSEFVDSILADLTKLLFRQAIVGLFDLATGGSGTLGNLIGGAAGGLPGRAGGGPVTAGQPYMVGEHGPEPFIPNQSGVIVPNGSMPAGANVTIVNVTDENEVARVLASSKGQDVIMNVIRKNAKGVKQIVG